MREKKGREKQKEKEKRYLSQDARKRRDGEMKRIETELNEKRRENVRRVC